MRITLKTTKFLIIASLLFSVLLLSGCIPLTCPKCSSDNLKEIGPKGDFTYNRLECLDCGNITYEP